MTHSVYLYTFMTHVIRTFSFLLLSPYGEYKRPMHISNWTRCCCDVVGPRRLRRLRRLRQLRRLRGAQLPSSQAYRRSRTWRSTPHPRRWSSSSRPCRRRSRRCRGRSAAKRSLWPAASTRWARSSKTASTSTRSKLARYAPCLSLPPTLVVIEIITAAVFLLGGLAVARCFRSFAQRRSRLVPGWVIVRRFESYLISHPD